MPTSPDRAVTLAVLVVLGVTLPMVWAVGEVRDQQAADAKQADLVAQVPARQAPADYDGDGVSDSTDRCPTRPETTNGFQDGDGCPDVVATTRAS
jgi:hypothetical protein